MSQKKDESRMERSGLPMSWSKLPNEGVAIECEDTSGSSWTKKARREFVDKIKKQIQIPTLSDPTNGLDWDEYHGVFSTPKEESVESTAKPSWKSGYLGINTETASRLQDIFNQRMIDNLNEQAAAIFTDPNAGTTAPGQDWQIRSVSCNEPGCGCNLGKEPLIKLSEGLEGIETMNLYQVYIVDLKDHSIEEYGPSIAKNSGAAGRQALAWLVADANDENTPIEIYDGDIEHYHIFVAKIASGIPDKITNE